MKKNVYFLVFSTPMNEMNIQKRMIEQLGYGIFESIKSFSPHDGCERISNKVIKIIMEFPDEIALLEERWDAKAYTEEDYNRIKE